LGAECAGRITAVGSGVTDFKPGDEVLAVSPSLNNNSLLTAYTTLPAELVVAKPVSLSLTEAATIPINFLTAHYALNYLGRLQAGERVLIHSAAGGVGLAAVQLCQLAGAEIFATAGSPEKRAYLRQLGIRHVFDSRSLDFAAEIMAGSDGAGVDLVLNSLAGEALRQSLAVLAPYGRFLEIGKRDIYQNSPLGLAPFKKNLSFFAIDLARVIEERPSLIGTLLRDLVEQAAAGKLRPLPLTTYPIHEATQAFHTMAQGQHTGKIVLTFSGDHSQFIIHNSQFIIHNNATYLITGGLGSLGLLTAEWLAEQGARHLLLVGRSAPSEATQQRLKALQQAGVEAVVAQADVTQANQVAALLAQIEREMPPLRGIVHAAGLLADSTLLQMDRAQLLAPMAPKVYGGWHLHQLTREMPLDFFVLFSSVAALMGLPGQANYAAANAFLDALAWQRQREGLPALTINWGPWAEVGLAAVQTNRGDRLAQRGLGSIPPQEGLAVLGRLLRQTAVQVAVMPFAADRWRQSHPQAAETSLLRHLLAAQVDTPAMTTPADEADVRTALLALEPGRPRRAYLEAHLQQQVAQVLRLAPNRVEIQRPVKQLGLDSLMAVELRNRLESSLGVTLSATLVFNYPTIAAMAPYLAQKMGISLEAAAAEPVADNTAQQPADIVASVKQLSDAEAEALLLKELAEIEL
jgi:phthiocerol/phenolphthiocerol synthesis type-I polyketide synthase C